MPPRLPARAAAVVSMALDWPPPVATRCAATCRRMPGPTPGPGLGDGLPLPAPWTWASQFALSAPDSAGGAVWPRRFLLAAGISTARGCTNFFAMVRLGLRYTSTMRAGRGAHGASYLTLMVLRNGPNLLLRTQESIMLPLPMLSSHLRLATLSRLTMTMTIALLPISLRQKLVAILDGVGVSLLQRSKRTQLLLSAM